MLQIYSRPPRLVAVIRHRLLRQPEPQSRSPARPYVVRLSPRAGNMAGQGGTFRIIMIYSRADRDAPLALDRHPIRAHPATGPLDLSPAGSPHQAAAVS